MSPSVVSSVVGAISFEVDGRPVEVPDDGGSLLDALRDRLGVGSVKDGCSPQGQCGCCTVLVDGSPRVACVTPIARIAGRRVTTVDGLPADERDAWAAAFCATGASQCGFCTPGIVVRLHAARARGARTADDPRVGQALLAHLCRCTGWRTIFDAVDVIGHPAPARDLDAAARRAEIEGGVLQRVGPEIALGRGGFADDTAPADALVAVRAPDGGWVVDETVHEARRRAGKVQGRRTTAALSWPIDIPEGDWAATLQTTWVEPAYLEPDASWCVPGGMPVSPLANGGAFGGKTSSDAGAVARRLADEHGRPVRVLWSREDVVRFGPKRPPIGAGIRADGTGVVRVARTPGIANAITAIAPGLVVEEVDVTGPPTSLALRAAGWAEAAVLLSSVTASFDHSWSPGDHECANGVVDPGGGRASAWTDDAGEIHVIVDAGEAIDEVVLRSYIVGAAHQALGWVRSEGISVDADGEVHDLTIRSFGILRAVDMPPVHVTVTPSEHPPVRGSDAAFAAVAAAVWRHDGYPSRWPSRRA